MNNLSKYTAVLISMIVAIAIIPSTAQASDKIVIIPSIVIGGGYHYDKPYYKNKHYNKKYYKNSYNSNNYYNSSPYNSKYYGKSYKRSYGKSYSKGYNRGYNKGYNKNYRSSNGFKRNNRSFRRSR